MKYLLDYSTDELRQMMQHSAVLHDVFPAYLEANHSTDSSSCISIHRSSNYFVCFVSKWVVKFLFLNAMKVIHSKFLPVLTSKKNDQTSDGLVNMVDNNLWDLFTYQDKTSHSDSTFPLADDIMNHEWFSFWFWLGQYWSFGLIHLFLLVFLLHFAFHCCLFLLLICDHFFYFWFSNISTLSM